MGLHRQTGTDLGSADALALPESSLTWVRSDLSKPEQHTGPGKALERLTLCIRNTKGPPLCLCSEKALAQIQTGMQA